MKSHPRFQRQNLAEDPDTEDFIPFDVRPDKNRPDMNTQFQTTDLRHRINAAKAEKYVNLYIFL